MQVLVGFGTGNSPKQITVQQALADGFVRDNPLATVEFIRVPSSKEASTKLTLLLDGGTPPDLIMPIGVYGTSAFVDPAARPPPAPVSTARNRGNTGQSAAVRRHPDPCRPRAGTPGGASVALRSGGRPRTCSTPPRRQKAPTPTRPTTNTCWAPVRHALRVPAGRQRAHRPARQGDRRRSDADQRRPQRRPRSVPIGPRLRDHRGRRRVHLPALLQPGQGRCARQRGVQACLRPRAQPRRSRQAAARRQRLAGQPGFRPTQPRDVRQSRGVPVRPGPGQPDARRRRLPAGRRGHPAGYRRCAAPLRRAVPGRGRAAARCHRARARGSRGGADPGAGRHPAGLFPRKLGGVYDLALLFYPGPIGPGPTGDPDYLRQIFSSRTEMTFYSPNGYANPALDDLADRQLVATDTAERTRLVGEIQRLLAVRHRGL